MILRDKSIQIGAVNHEDDLEMADFLDAELKRIDEKNKAKNQCSCHDCVQFGLSQHPTEGVK